MKREGRGVEEFRLLELGRVGRMMDKNMSVACQASQASQALNKELIAAPKTHNTNTPLADQLYNKNDERESILLSCDQNNIQYSYYDKS